MKGIKLAFSVVVGTLKALVKMALAAVKAALQLLKRTAAFLLGTAFAILFSPVLLPMRFFKMLFGGKGKKPKRTKAD